AFIVPMMVPESLHPNFNIFIFCAELDEDDYDNWQDTKLWAKANPGLNAPDPIWSNKTPIIAIIGTMKAIIGVLLLQIGSGALVGLAKPIFAAFQK
ncbi:hypothetical protein, partial [Mycoplasmopsis bovis]|uniref:hypothetical protein n=1 Tax=Mycoplasmopsis bovis TaxID=28903 RepID=UPI003D2956BB